jgi:hypothetical protein
VPGLSPKFTSIDASFFYVITLAIGALHAVLFLHHLIRISTQELIALGVRTDVVVLESLEQFFLSIGRIVVLQAKKAIDITKNTDSG